MANESRTPGLKGALPRHPERYVPILEHYLLPYEGPIARRTAVTGPVIPPVRPTQTIDRETKVSDWPMYVNGPDPSNPSDVAGGCGDCTIAGKAHGFAAQRVYAGYAEPAFSNDVILAAYSAVSGYVRGDSATDSGCAEPDVLQFMHQRGLADTQGTTHVVAAWAAFGDPTNLNLMAAALNTFGTVTVDIDCPQSAEQQFEQGVPWTYDPDSPSLGYHSIVLQKRGTGYVGVQEFITWGAVQRATRIWCKHQIKEAYVAVSEDFIRANGTTIQGFDLEQLVADMPGVE